MHFNPWCYPDDLFQSRVCARLLNLAICMAPFAFHDFLCYLHLFATFTKITYLNKVQSEYIILTSKLLLVDWQYIILSVQYLEKCKCNLLAGTEPELWVKGDGFTVGCVRQFQLLNLLLLSCWECFLCVCMCVCVCG